MRICHVIESAAGGSAAIMVSLALHAVRRGHEVHVVYSPDRADPAVIAALQAGGCASVRPSPMRRAITPRDAVDGWALRRTLNAIGPIDVIHSHSSKAGALARTFGRRRATAQVYSPHGFYTMTGAAPAYIATVERALSLLTDRIVAVSAHERRHAIELGIDPRRVTVIANGIAGFAPLSRAEARGQLGIPDDVFSIGFVGRLTAQKDPASAVEAAAAVDRRFKPLLSIIGDGELRGESERRCADLGAPVRFHGARDAKTLLGAFDCLLCTSRYEGMPVAFLEALYCGLPIVSYPVGGTDELVRDGETGFVTAAQPRAAAAAIERIAGASAGDKAAFAQACRALAAEHTDAIMGDETLALYREVQRARP